MGTTMSNVIKPEEAKQVSSEQESDVTTGCPIDLQRNKEADLHKHLVGCTKNPGHNRFIPIKTFCLEDLPKGYHDFDLYELIKVVADLTVRVKVKMTSPLRPEFYPGTNDPFPFYDMRNKTILRLGTGDLQVFMFTDGHACDPTESDIDVDGEKYFRQFRKSIRTCPCTKCQHSDKPNNVWWEIYVHTTTVVVFDVIEASHTSCRLFYDGQGSPVVSLDNFIVDYVSINEDKSVLKYVTCDSLGDKLYKMTVHRWDLWWKVFNKYKNKSDVNFSFIVSHPHGGLKKISIGHLLGNYRIASSRYFDLTKLTYTTCTCPGSSGANVYVVGVSNAHRHSGALDSGLNYSSVGIYRKRN